MKIAPPGDPRPAFLGDYELLKRTLSNLFSPRIVNVFLKEHILLNPASYIDKMDEIIVQGKVIGDLRYNPEKSEYEIVLNKQGAIFFFALASYLSGDLEKNLSFFKHFVIVSKEAGKKISEGYNVLAPGIMHFSTFHSGDLVFVFDEDITLVGIGVARVSSERLDFLSKGLVIKNKAKKLFLTFDNAKTMGKDILDNILHKPLDREIAWDTDTSPLFIEEYDPYKLFPQNIRRRWMLITYANLTALQKREEEARAFITHMSRRSLPITVSFSGGKDSIVTFELVRKTLQQNFIVFFINTGIEYPETIEYTKKVLRTFEEETNKSFRNGRVIIIDDVELILGKSIAIANVPSQRFWIGFRTIGPPGMDWRWCCKSNKLAPTRQLLEKLGIAKTVCFVGIRKYESLQRASEGRVSENPWTGQLNAYPIYYWNALDTWLYILWRRLPANPLYGKGLSRIGCWPCPCSNLADFFVLKEIHPDLSEMLHSELIRIAQEQGIPENMINNILKYGSWRWLKPPKKVPGGKIYRPLLLPFHLSQKEDGSISLEIKRSGEELDKLEEFLKSILKALKSRED